MLEDNGGGKIGLRVGGVLIGENSKEQTVLRQTEINTFIRRHLKTNLK